METVKEMAASLAKGPPLALGLIKQAAYASMENDLEQQLIMETAGQHRLFLTEDCKEAASSFMEKREPKFKGK